MFKKYDVVREANAVVENRVGLLQDLYEVKKMRMDAKSRLICRCPSCRGEQEDTLAWIESLRQQGTKA